MNLIVILVVAIVFIALGYFVHAKRVDRTNIKPDNKKATPARMFMDALGPIIGPITAVLWGWVPALIWVVLGTFFIGWVQDYTSIMLGSPGREPELRRRSRSTTCPSGSYPWACWVD
jgi:carbon starvation protein